MEKGIISNKTEKGYCFIRSSTGESIFVHINNVGKETYEQLAKGSKVLFEYEESQKRKSVKEQYRQMIAKADENMQENE